MHMGKHMSDILSPLNARETKAATSSEMPDRDGAKVGTRAPYATLEQFIRRLHQPRGGYVPLSEMNNDIYGKPRVSLDDDFSPMLLSSVVRHIAAFAAYTDKDLALIPSLRRARGSIERIANRDQKAREVERIDELITRIYDSPVSLDGIMAWCRLLTFAPMDVGGMSLFPDGGRVLPTEDNARLIHELSHRTARFVVAACEEGGEGDMAFDAEITRLGQYPDFAHATVNFLSPKGAFKVMPTSKLPQTRDTLLVATQAIIAEVDEFGIYNPMMDVLHWGHISELPEAVVDQIKVTVLGMDIEAPAGTDAAG